MGVGSEVWGAVCAGRRGIGVELKPSYFRQAVKNMALAAPGSAYKTDQPSLALDDSSDEAWPDLFDVA
jgi:hypothetical protein